jgi:hypothetical protein
VARADIKLDSAGIVAMLKSSGTQSLVHDAAESIARSAEGATGGRAENGIVVDDFTAGDRAASSVTIRDVRSRLWEARDGVLTRAAASAGLEVRST